MSVLVQKHAAYLTSALVGQKILSFFYFLALARTLGVEQTGQYVLALSLTTIFSVLSDLGLTQAVIRQTAQEPKDGGRFFAEALGWKIPCMAMTVAATLVFVHWFYSDKILFALVSVGSIIVLLDALSLLSFGVLRGLQRLQYESLGMVVGQGLTVLFGGILLATNPRPLTLLFALVLGSAWNAIFATIQVVRRFGIYCLIPIWPSVASARMFRWALPFALGFICIKVYSYADSILLSKLVNTAAVGLYGVAYKFTYAFQFLPMAFVAALYPAMSSAHARTDKRELENLLSRGLWYMILLAFPISAGLFVVAPHVVDLVGNDFSASAPILRVLIWALIPIFLDFPVGSLLNASHRAGLKTTLTAITMVLNLALNILLIPRLGALGAAWAGTISFTFLFLSAVPFVIKQVGRGAFLSVGGDTIRIGSSAGLMALAVSFLIPIIGWIPSSAIGAVIYFLLLFITRAIRFADLTSVLHHATWKT